MAMKGCPNGHWFDDAEHGSCPYCTKKPEAKPSGVSVAPVQGGGYENPPTSFGADIGKTVPLNAPGGPAALDKTQPVFHQNGIDRAREMPPPDLDKTQPLFHQNGAERAAAGTPPQAGHADSLSADSQSLRADFQNAPRGGYGNPPTSMLIDSDKTQPIFRDRFAEDYLVGWLVCVSGASKGKDFTIHTEVNHIGRNSNMDICITGDNSISRENHASITYDTRDRLFYLAPGGGRAIIRHNDKPALTSITLSPYDEIELGQTKLIFIPLCGNSFDWSNYS
jgi:hypothetical protein